MKVGTIIQARMGSTRLPGKVMLKLPKSGELSILDHIVKRAEQAGEVVIATTTLAKDDVLVDRYSKVFRGSELDVLKRYYLCAQEYGFDHVVRLTSDNPIVDYESLKKTIEEHLESKADYTCSTGLPLGCNFEVISVEALCTADLESKDAIEREHVTKYIKNNPSKFNVREVTFEFEYPIRLTVDYPTDYELMDKLFSELGEDFDLKQLSKYISKNPEVMSINRQNQQLS